MSHLYAQWQDLMNNKSDPRTTNLFLMQCPLPTLMLCIGYFYIVKILGPKFMEARKPFKVTKLLIIYNFLQTIWSCYLFWEIGMAGWFGRYNWRCEAFDPSNDEYAVRSQNALKKVEMMLKILETFCGHTNLHGFIYIVQPWRHKIEKFFWLISILISFILTGILINKLIIESQKNSIVIYMDQNPIKVQDLVFPAVAMCLGVLGRTPCKTQMFYDGAKSLLERNKTAIKPLKETQLKLLQIGSLLSRDRFMSDNFPTLNISTDNLMELLGILKRNISTISHNTSQTLFSEKSWKYPFPHQIPVIAQGPGKGLFIKFWTFHYCQPQRKAYNFFKNSLQQTELDGLVLRFHDPYEFLSNDAPKFHMVRDKLTTLSIVPKIIRIDDSLLDVEIDV
ncbi:unnamed protein product [Chironomus riparius]|uniref:Elongation of very long chain fatty acids protein n=1 Tax=Chironomus riparius TaxID=315576 RepID=A0A9N9S7Q9_9DIPT|nr:unnamed protein product [Chironomus riparius]